MSLRISNCGNAAATRSRDGISDVAVAGTPASVAVAAPSRMHLGQSPCGGLGRNRGVALRTVVQFEGVTHTRFLRRAGNKVAGNSHESSGNLQPGEKRRLLLGDDADFPQLLPTRASGSAGSLGGAAATRYQVSFQR